MEAQEIRITQLEEIHSACQDKIDRSRRESLSIQAELKNKKDDMYEIQLELNKSKESHKITQELLKNAQNQAKNNTDLC